MSGGVLRILQVGSTRYRGGVSAAIVGLCRALAAEGHQVHLMGDGGDAAEALADHGVGLSTVPLESSPWWAARGAVAVRRVLRSLEPDVVHVHGRAASLACTLAGRFPDWFTLHNTHLTERVGWFDRGAMRRYLSPLGRRLFVLDDRAAAYCRDALGVPRWRVRCVPNGVDCDRFTPGDAAERRRARARFRLLPQERLVLFVGRFHPQKQPEAVVRLAAAAASRGLDHARFVLVGEGELEPVLRKHIRRAELGSRCHLVGWSDPLDAYRAADLLVMPSRYEGYGLVAAEALAAGCPVLRSRTGGFEAMIAEGVTGFGCDSDPEDFVRVGLRVLRRPEVLDAMRPAAARHARQALSVRHQAREVVAAYRQALAPKARPRPAGAFRAG
ncbi:MAG: glycosyltransferase family 4 protein [Myxococcota bacterium]